MAHELTFNAAGEAETFQVLVPAWHREGIVLEAPPTLDEALTIAGLRFEVSKRTTYRQVEVPNGHDEDGNPKTVTEYFENSSAYITYRDDTGAELGAVGPGYSVLQNADAFRAIEPLLDSGVLQLETGGSLREGADVWLMGKFDIEKFGPIVREVFADEVVPYCLFTNNHAGRRAASVSLTPVRVVCANTLGYTERLAEDGKHQEIKIQHTGDAAEKMIAASESLLGGIVERYEVLAKHYRALKSSFLTDAEFKTLVLDVVSPDPRESKKFNPEAKLADLVIERHERRVNLVTHLWRNGKGHRGDHSCWEAYNGAVQAIDHDTDVFPVRGGAWRTQALLDGKLASLKQHVLENVARASAESYEQAEAIVSTLG